MAFDVMKIPLSVLSESEKKRSSTPFELLSDSARILVQFMAEQLNQTGRRRFSINDLRYNRIGSWRQLEDSLYELESRGFGTVESDGAEISFSAAVPVLQSI